MAQRFARSGLAGPCARMRGAGRLPLLISLVLAAVAPAAAGGDVYKWTDERGKLNFSNVPPVKGARVKHLEVIATDSGTPTIPPHEATPTEQALLARIREVERQLHANELAAQRAQQQTAQQAADRAAQQAAAERAAPPRYTPAYAGSAPVIQPPPAAPAYAYPPADYYGGGYSYGANYAPVYYYPFIPLYAYAAYAPRGYYVRPGYAGQFRGGFGGMRGGGGRGGRR